MKRSRGSPPAAARFATPECRSSFRHSRASSKDPVRNLQQRLCAETLATPEKERSASRKSSISMLFSGEAVTAKQRGETPSQRIAVPGEEAVSSQLQRQSTGITPSRPESETVASSVEKPARGNTGDSASVEESWIHTEDSSSATGRGRILSGERLRISHNAMASPTRQRLGASHNAASLDKQQVADNLVKQLRKLEECSQWLKAVYVPESTQSKPLERLQKAITALLQPSEPRERDEIQKLLYSWNVPQWNKGKRSYGEVKAELLAKVIKETHRLQKMDGAPEIPSPHAEANAAVWRFSAIRASFQNAAADRR